MGYILQERFGTCAKHQILLYVFTLVHLCIQLKTDGATNKSAKTYKEGLLHKARSDQTDMGWIACKKLY